MSRRERPASPDPRADPPADPRADPPADLSAELLDPALREVIATGTARFLPYQRYGAPVPGLEWLPLSGEPGGDGYECFLIRFAPGAASRAHEHTGHEEFLVLEGELEDCDGSVYRSGDFVKFAPGSRHRSVSRRGCLLLVTLRGRNRALADAR